MADAPPIRILHLEDNKLDAELLSSVLEGESVPCDIRVVDTEPTFRAALAAPELDLVISDYSIPSFSGLAALQISRTTRPGLPFIFVSGTIGEERAIEALKQGATDYVLKQRPARLVPAIRRALAERDGDRARVHAQDQHRDAEERLRSSAEQFRAVADTIPCALFIYEGSKRVYVNRWAEQLTGYTRGELLGGDLWDLVHPDQRDEARERGLVRPGGEDAASLYELRLRTKSGEERWVLVSTGALQFEGRPASLATAIDITERKRAEQALRLQTASLAQAEKLAAMGSLLAGVAHELNNPLAVVVGHTELLARGLEGAPAQRAAKISSAAARCARIVKNFLALARQRPPERQWVDLKKVVEEALELVSYSLTSSGVEVTTDLWQNIPPLWADPHQLHQVVVNLVTNAHHALRAQEGTRRLLVGAGILDERTVWIDVADTGPGIPAGILRRVFEPFFTTKPAGEGTGLGLSLCRGIVESHGGAIRLHSQVGQGTVFRIELPITRAPEQTALPAESPAGAGETARVLVVDDEADLGVMMAEILSEQGHRVDVVTYGQQALERMATTTYDVILCDLRMPGMDGPTLYALVKTRFPGQERRFVFVTGDTFTGSGAAFVESTGVPSLSKPFTVDEVERVVSEVRRRGGGA